MYVWLGNKQIDPTDWGWLEMSILSLLSKIEQLPPDKVLKLISCGCKQNCSDKSCSCVKAGLKCTILCSGCNGRDCNNCVYFQSEGTD